MLQFYIADIRLINSLPCSLLLMIFYKINIISAILWLLVKSWAGKEEVRRKEEVAYYYTRVKKNVTTAASSFETWLHSSQQPDE